MAFSDGGLLPEDLGRRVEIEVKYAGYIRREEESLQRQRTMEDRAIPNAFWAGALRGVSNEGREALLRVRPENVGQAARVRGVSPADLGVLLIRLEEYRKTSDGVDGLSREEGGDR